MRTHVSQVSEPFEVEPCEQEDRPSHKPRGFWYEVDGDWRRWCDENEYGHARAHLFSVDLGTTNILRIGTDTRLHEFHGIYRASVTPDRPYTSWYIDWDRVSLDWDGIEIAPYLWNCRMDPERIWYYSWDCASGCIWRPKGVSLTYLHQIERALVR